MADVGGISGLSVTSLAIRAGTGAVSLDGNGNNVSNLAGIVNNGGFSFTDNVASAAAPLNITTVDGLSGIDTSAGNGTRSLCRKRFAQTQTHTQQAFKVLSLAWLLSFSASSIFCRIMFARRVNAANTCMTHVRACCRALTY